MESLKTVCLLVLFMAIVSTPGSTGLHLGVSFEQLNELVKDKMYLKCAGDGRVHGPRMTLMMKLGKVGDPKPLAVFNLGTGITVTPMKASKTITAVGHVDKVSSLIFLNVMIDRPDEKDAGTYTCQLLYMDQQHQIHEEKELLKVVIEAPDTSTLVKYFVHQVEDLKETVTNIIATQNKTAATHNKKIADLNTRADNLRDSMAIVNHTVKANTKSTQSHDRVLADLNATDIIAMRDQFQDFKTKATYQCAFMTKYQLKRVVKRRELSFRDIVLNLGGAYNPETGVFTAPVDGLYVFHLIVGTGSKNEHALVQLRVNKKPKTGVEGFNKDWSDQSSTSAVLRLQSGDKLDAHIHIHNGDKNQKLGHGSTILSGFLLQAI